MKSLRIGTIAFLSFLFLTVQVAAQEKEKKKAERVSGDVGLLNLEKNYMILVTKEGKLITLDFTDKTKVTLLKESEAKIGDIGLGSSASIEYTPRGEKSVLTKIEFMQAKSGE